VNQKHRVSKKIKTSGGVNGMLFVAPFHVWSTSQNTVTLWDAKVLDRRFDRRCVSCACVMSDVV
jgi:hypothetical protein